MINIFSTDFSYRSGRISEENSWPLSYVRGEERLLIWLVSDLSDTLAITRKIEKLANETEWTGERLFQGLEDIVSRKTYRPLNLVAVKIGAEGELELFSWRGKVILKRGAKAGVLLRGDEGKLEVRVGMIQEGDILVLTSDKSQGVEAEKDRLTEENWREILAAGQGWAEFVALAKEGLAEIGMSGGGLVIEGRGQAKKEEAAVEDLGEEKLADMDERQLTDENNGDYVNKCENKSVDIEPESNDIEQENTTEKEETKKIGFWGKLWQKKRSRELEREVEEEENLRRAREDEDEVFGSEQEREVVEEEVILVPKRENIAREREEKTTLPSPVLPNEEEPKQVAREVDVKIYSIDDLAED